MDCLSSTTLFLKHEGSLSGRNILSLLNFHRPFRFVVKTEENRYKPRILKVQAKKSWKKKLRSRKISKKFDSFSGLAVITTLVAGLMATFTAPFVALASFMTFFSLISILGALFGIFWPLLPILAFFGIPTILFKLNILLFVDRFLSVLLVFNLLGAVASSYLSGFLNLRKWFSEARLTWDLKTTLSLTPVVNGSSWLILLSESTKNSKWQRKVFYIKNFIIYSLPVLPLLCQWIIFPSNSFFSGVNTSVWLSVVIGAIHMQLEKRLCMLTGNLEEDDDEQDNLESFEDLERTRAFEEFDALLRKTPSLTPEGDFLQ